jgi:hypothetical protein
MDHHNERFGVTDHKIDTPSEYLEKQGIVQKGAGSPHIQYESFQLL